MTTTAKYGDIDILYEDNHLLVVNKPVNLLSQSDQTGDDDLQNLLKRYLKERYQKPGNVFLALVQRLDRGTGGVMVLARTSKAASRLSEQIRNREIEKNYLAVVASKQVQQGVITHYLKKDKEQKKALVCKNAVPGGQKAVLEIAHLQTAGSKSLVSIALKTGRFHQIRAQLSDVGMPIWGDRKYGAPSPPGTAMCLICNRLTFRHPTQQETLTFAIGMPDTPPWNQFSTPEVDRSDTRP